MNISGDRFGTVDVGGRAHPSDVIMTPERAIGYLGRRPASPETRRYLGAQGDADD